ncbi:helix-turn-helix transcriptional regulator [Natronomonas marina]|jgi:DNA-binding PadR family transcriptional regulator|uniref:helix-turn-helix transcriptional regulator n=1 Tax=Natronomonas marina TaxID=2961939 RepID=UPI0020CA1C7B|nr:helix-turn-helix transcriptional regulator [Natronomonas marina]
MSYPDGQNTSDPTADMLLQKLQASGNADDGADDDPAAETAALLSETADTVHGGDELRVDDGLVKQSLSDLLLLLVGLRRDDAHGKGVMNDLNRFFGTQLSPGTVYPALHELEEEGLLDVRELVQTKEYFIDDEAAVRESLQEAMTQHLAMGFLFQRALEELDEQ